MNWLPTFTLRDRLSLNLRAILKPSFNQLVKHTDRLEKVTYTPISGRYNRNTKLKWQSERETNYYFFVSNLNFCGVIFCFLFWNSLFPWSQNHAHHRLKNPTEISRIGISPRSEVPDRQTQSTKNSRNLVQTLSLKNVKNWILLAPMIQWNFLVRRFSLEAINFGKPQVDSIKVIHEKMNSHYAAAR